MTHFQLKVATSPYQPSQLSPPLQTFEIMEKEGWKGEEERSCQLRRIGSTDRPLPCAFNAL